MTISFTVSSGCFYINPHPTRKSRMSVSRVVSLPTYENGSIGGNTGPISGVRSTANLVCGAKGGRDFLPKSHFQQSHNCSKVWNKFSEYVSQSEERSKFRQKCL